MYYQVAVGDTARKYRELNYVEAGLGIGWQSIFAVHRSSNELLIRGAFAMSRSTMVNRETSQDIPPNSNLISRETPRSTMIVLYHTRYVHPFLLTFASYQSLGLGGAVASSLTTTSWLCFCALSPFPKKMTSTVRSSLCIAKTCVSLHITPAV